MQPPQEREITVVLNSYQRYPLPVGGSSLRSE